SRVRLCPALRCAGGVRPLSPKHQREGMSHLVIGAGPAGLAAIRSLRDAGLAVEAAERNADVGGQWLYGAASSAVYASTHLISSKSTTAFADFPMPEAWPAYPGRVQIEQYFKDYARHFDLYPL